MKGHLISTLSTIAVVNLSVVANAALVEWPVSKGGNGHFYEPVAVRNTITWFEAYEAAKLSGGYLVTITSQQEQDFVEALVDDDAYWDTEADGSYGPWIGGFQLPGSPEPDGGWKWIIDEPLTYTNWGQDQPNNLWGTEHCIHLGSYDFERTTIIWNDLTANVTNIRGYIIEYSGRCQDELIGDLNDDCRVDLLDFAIMAENWLNDCSFLLTTGKE